MKRILVARTDRVGDVVMITPMIRELRRHFPDCYLAALTNNRSAAVLQHNPHLDAVITDDMRSESFWPVVKSIRSHHFTDALLAWPAERAAYQLFLAGIPRRTGVGHKIYEMITFMRSVNRNYNPPRHEADYCMDLARSMGIVTDNLTPEMFLTEEEHQWGRDYMVRRGADKSTRIIVHTGCRNSSANWSEKKYAALIRGILDQDTDRRVRIFLTAPEMTRNFLDTMQAWNDGRITNVLDRLELPEKERLPNDAEQKESLRYLIKIIAACDVVIASSTGPMHLASALGVKTISIFCHRPTNCVQRWGALGPNAVNLEVSAEHCDAHCGLIKETCVFEDGIAVADVLRHIGI